MCNESILKDLLGPYFISLTSILSENAKILFVALFIGPNGFCLLNVNFYKSEIYSLFRDNGFLHLFAISGSNLILLSNFLGLVLKPLRILIRTELLKVVLLCVYVLLIVGLDVIPAVRALTTEIITFILKRYGVKIEYKYITILLFMVFLIIRVENINNKSFLLTFGILIISLLSLDVFKRKIGMKWKSDSFLTKYVYESIFTFFYPLLVINNINLTFSQIFYGLIVKEILDILAVFYYISLFTLGRLNGIISPVTNLLVETLTSFLRTTNISILKIEYSNILLIFVFVLISLLLLASVRKFMRESFLVKYVPVAQLDRARHS